MLKIKENVPASELSTFRLGGLVRYFLIAETQMDVKDAVEFAKQKDLPFVVTGDGSNIIWSDDTHSVVALQVALQGMEVISEDATSITYSIGAGENWDNFVAFAVSQNVSGVEAMSAIPGTVGATPVQNVGAYGQEIKDVFVSLEAYDMNNKEVRKLSLDDCRFRYRDSLFKSDEKGRYIILYVVLKLSKLPPTIPKYPGVKKYFEENGIENPTLQEIRNAIIEIRKSKLPNPTIVPNCGSFFENPIVTKKIANAIKQNFPDAKMFDLPDDTVKVPAGWLIERAGFKGRVIGNGKIKVHPDNALVLTNFGGATFADLDSAREEIRRTVTDMFGIELEQEPNVIDF